MARSPLASASADVLDLARSPARPGLRTVGLPDIPEHTEAVDPRRDVFQEGWDAFLFSLGPQNVKMFGAGIRSLGVTVQNETIFDMGYDIEEWSGELGMGQPGSVPHYEDIESVGDFFRYVAGATGQAVGSFAVPIAGGLAGAGAGAVAGAKVAGVGAAPGAVVGGVGGAFVANDIILAGEAYLQFTEDEGIDPYDAATLAQTIAPAMAALDTLGLAKVLGMPARRARQGLLSYVARQYARGMTIEGATEGAQGLIREATAARETGRQDWGERLSNVLNETIAAGLGGGVVSGGVSAVRGVAGRRQDDIAEEDIDDLPPEQEETGVAAPPGGPGPEAGPGPGLGGPEPQPSGGQQQAEPGPTPEPEPEPRPKPEQKGPESGQDTRSKADEDAEFRRAWEEENKRRTEFRERMERERDEWDATDPADRSPEEISAFWERRRRAQQEEGERAREFDRQREAQRQARRETRRQAREERRRKAEEEVRAAEEKARKAREKAERDRRARAKAREEREARDRARHEQEEADRRRRERRRKADREKQRQEREQRAQDREEVRRERERQQAEARGEFPVNYMANGRPFASDRAAHIAARKTHGPTGEGYRVVEVKDAFGRVTGYGWQSTMDPEAQAAEAEAARQRRAEEDAARDEQRRQDAEAEADRLRREREAREAAEAAQETE